MKNLIKTILALNSTLRGTKFTKEKKRVPISYTVCRYCGERHIDDPWYEHKCEGRGNQMVYTRRIKPEWTGCTGYTGYTGATAVLGNEAMRDAHRSLMMYGRYGGSQTEIVRSREHLQHRLTEASIARRSNSYSEFVEMMARNQQELEQRQPYRAQAIPPQAEWTDTIFRSAGMVDDARDARDFAHNFNPEPYDATKLQTV